MIVSEQMLAQALQILASGGIVAHATETCYGFACDLTNPEAVKHLFALKKRPLDSPVSALFSSLDEAKKFVEWNDEAEKLARKYLPGPLTLILPQREKSPVLWIVPSPKSQVPSPKSLGVRISSHPLAQNLVAAFGKPLSTTSANLHGMANAYSAEEIVEQFSKQKLKPDLILDSGKIPNVPPSKVIDLTNKGKILRQ
ncbi:MAG: L-threonylcarbamoyladenylate synthase [Candidatus Peribacteraceae bacterium]